ncbi:hypothetical protein [Streptomyces acidiscabies]|uniref:VMAP-C domain-containing protein n=1 Tax=Streptomyces acidiscabies TaxID=42234 RepID=UPI0038F744CD
MADPRRTHALIVAVEAHEDPDWNVQGPCADASAFVSWLVDGCGVPAGNITVFASPLDATRLTGTAWREASSHAVARHLLEGMADLEADLLWVFWSGHGLVDGSGSHVLLLADSTPTTKYAVDVDALQLALQSTRVGARQGRGVPKVAVALNACQNQPRGGGLSRVGVVTDSPRVTERGLFVLHACSTGQRARVAPAETWAPGEAASLFPRTLLRFLDDGSCDVLPDLHRVSDRVDAEFAVLREKRLTAQKPSLSRRNWDGRTAVSGEFLVPPTAEEVALAGLLDAVLPDGAARARCARLLAERAPVMVPVSDGAGEPTARQIVTAAARTPHGVPTLVDLLPGDLRAAGRDLRPNEFLTHEEHARLTALLAAVPDVRATALYDRRLRHHVTATDGTDALLRSLEAAGCGKDIALPPLLRFTSLVAAEAEARTGDGGGLIRWGADVARRTGHAGALRARVTAAGQEAVRRRGGKAWLLVRLDVDDPEAAAGEGRYTSAAWLVDPAEQRPQRLPGARPANWRRTQLTLAELIEPLLGARHDLGVEFFLPHGQLELQVERIPVRHRGVDNTALGQVATVVVRCVGRRTPWERRWLACGHGAAAGDHHWLRRDAGDLAGLRSALAAAPDVGCVELSGDCREFTPALAYCAEAGVPVMTWHRRVDGVRQGGDLTDLRTGVPPRLLPEEVRDLRGDRDGPAPGLVLLWDDPGRLPPRPRPRVPGRTPRP